MRRRNSVSSASGTFTRNGRIAVLSVACSLRSCIALAVFMLPPERHDTRCAACVLSDEGIDDTFVSVRSSAHSLSNRVARSMVGPEQSRLRAKRERAERAPARRRCDVDAPVGIDELRFAAEGITTGV